MLWHVEHWFLAVSAFIQMLMAFPITWLAYTYILQSTYIGVLDLLSLFICIAIGVDDVFVFSDAFQKAEVLADMADRLGYTYRKAGIAMLITSVTTAMAFCSNMASSIPAIRSFGAVLGLLTIANYFLVMTAYPATVAFYIWFFKKKPSLDHIELLQEEVGQVETNPVALESLEDGGGSIEMESLVATPSTSPSAGHGSGHSILAKADVGVEVDVQNSDLDGNSHAQQEGSLHHLPADNGIAAWQLRRQALKQRVVAAKARVSASCNALQAWAGPMFIKGVTEKFRLPLCVAFVMLLGTAAALISQMPTAGKMKLFAEGTDVQAFLDVKDANFLSENENPESTVPILDAANAAIDDVVNTPGPGGDASPIERSLLRQMLS